RGVRRHEVLHTVADPPIVLPPSHFPRIRVEVGTGNVMVNADFGATDAREKRLGLIGASLTVGIANRVVDALCQITSMQVVPMRRFVGMYCATFNDALADSRDRLAL